MHVYSFGALTLRYTILHQFAFTGNDLGIFLTSQSLQTDGKDKRRMSHKNALTQWTVLGPQYEGHASQLASLLTSNMAYLLQTPPLDHVQ